MADRLPFSSEQYWNACKRNAFKGAFMFTFEAGTTGGDENKKTTWTTADESIAHTNPIQADANGIFPEIYGNGSFFIEIKNNALNEIVVQADEINGAGTQSFTLFDTIALALAATGNIGDFVQTAEYISGSGVGGAKYKIVAGGTGTDDGGGFLDKSDGNQLELRPEEGVVYATQWGTVDDGTTVGGTDNGPKINAASVYAKANRGSVNTVRWPQGSFSIEEPLLYLQSVNVIGYGTSGGSVGGTEIICNFSASTISTPPTDNETGRYSPVLAFTPMFYNTELITQQSYGGFRLNGNNKDVYGIYLNEWFFTESDPIFIINCNKFPFTGLVGQFNNMDFLTCNNCKQGLRFVGADTLNIRGLDTEGNQITGSQLDFVQDQNFSTKGGNKIATWHFEETATDFPTVFGRVSGRNLHIDESSFGTSGTPALRFFEILGNESFTFDGVNITTEQAVGTYMGGHSSSAAGSMGIQLNSGATGSYLNIGSGTEQDSIDNSGNTSNQLNTTSGGQRLPRDVTIRNSSGGTMMFFSTDSRINFFDNTNRFIEQSGANLNVVNTSGQITIDADNLLNLTGSVTNLQSGGSTSLRVDSDATAGNTRMLVFDVDNNTLERVTVGAADSGGAGFKVLRIPN